MDTAGNKDVVRRLYTLINEGRVEQVADLIAPDYQEHDPLPDKDPAEKGQ
jgi:predicted SnoaL-like aldol condensation-catalyzing enzyme